MTPCFHGTGQCRIWPWCSRSIALPAHASLHAACYAVHKHIGHKSNSTHSPAKHRRGTRDESYSCCGNHNFKISDSSTLKKKKSQKKVTFPYNFTFFFSPSHTEFCFAVPFGNRNKKKEWSCQSAQAHRRCSSAGSWNAPPALPQWHRAPACPTPG